MCCGGKCLFFINVRTGSLIFGYIIAVISALGTIACTGTSMYFGILLMFPYDYGMNGQQAMIAATIIIITGFMAEFLSSFICSVLLLVGITQKKTSLVKTFIVYGMVQVVLLFVFFIMMHCATSFFRVGFLFLALAFVGVYTLCIYMVFLTYQTMMRNDIAFVNPPVISGAGQTAESGETDNFAEAIELSYGILSNNAQIGLKDCWTK